VGVGGISKEQDSSMDTMLVDNAPKRTLLPRRDFLADDDRCPQDSWSSFLDVLIVDWRGRGRKGSSSAMTTWVCSDEGWFPHSFSFSFPGTMRLRILLSIVDDISCFSQNPISILLLSLLLLSKEKVWQDYGEATTRTVNSFSQPAPPGKNGYFWRRTRKNRITRIFSIRVAISFLPTTVDKGLTRSVWALLKGARLKNECESSQNQSSSALKKSSRTNRIMVARKQLRLWHLQVCFVL
jgi:hypothetical protein